MVDFDCFGDYPIGDSQEKAERDCHHCEMGFECVKKSRETFFSRPSQDEYFLRMAKLISSRSNCFRRAVGCVLVDKNNIVLATGYNGVPRGVKHCTRKSCPRENPGENLHECIAVHAEQNALMFCSHVDNIDRIYLTHSPCRTCTVMLLNTGCRKIIFLEPYPNQEDTTYADSKNLWISQGRIWKMGNT